MVFTFPLIIKNDKYVNMPTRYFWSIFHSCQKISLLTNIQMSFVSSSLKSNDEIVE